MPVHTVSLVLHRVTVAPLKGLTDGDRDDHDGAGDHAEATPFKLGTLERQGKAFLGIVLRDSLVVDFVAANTAIRAASAVASPSDMKDLIAALHPEASQRAQQA